MRVLRISFFAFIVFYCQQYVLAKPSIIAVALLSRHGDRTPSASYPKDPHIHYPWDGGFGALTEKGTFQMFKSGMHKASRYRSLVKTENGTSDLSRIYVRSSCVDRCVKSAENFLNGFLLEQWPSSLVKVVPRKEDKFLVITGRPCPKYASTIQKGYDIYQPEMSSFFPTPEDYAEFSVYIKNNTGLNMTSLRTLYILEDITEIEMDYGLQKPVWAESVYDQYVKPISQFTFDKRGSSRYMQVRSGVFLKDITERLEEAAKGSNKNVFLYFGHDLTQSALSICLEILEQTSPRPAYGSSLAFELHENSALLDDFEIKLVYFKDYSNEHPTEIQIPGCGTPCGFKRFKEIIRTKLILDYDNICRL